MNLWYERFSCLGTFHYLAWSSFHHRQRFTFTSFPEKQKHYSFLSNFLQEQNIFFLVLSRVVRSLANNGRDGTYTPDVLWCSHFPPGHCSSVSHWLFVMQNIEYGGFSGEAVVVPVISVFATLSHWHLWLDKLYIVIFLIGLQKLH